MALIETKLKADAKDVRVIINYSGTTPVLAGYEYQLKAENANQPIESHEGDNQNNQDDIYPLPSPISDNTGRKVVLTSKIAAIDADSDFIVRMDVLQDGVITDTLKSPGHVDKDGEAKLSFDIIKFI